MKPLQLKASKLSCQKQHDLLFSDIDFSLQAGDLLLVHGINGCGKSSLLRLLAGLSTPANGDIFWQSQSISHCQPEYAKVMHYVGHTNGIKLGLTVNENLELAGHLAQALPETTITSVLTALQLSHHRDSLAAILSAGQKRRLALAKLFLYPKALWVLDEPLTALDTETQAYFLQQLKHHLDQGGMAVISSHHAIPTDQMKVQTLRLSPC